MSDLRKQYPALERCVGTSSAVQSVLSDVVGVARTAYPVLLVGESGTGKELVARIIHDISGEPDRPFEAINCGAIPESLLESELFGHVTGAFTGANRNHRGVFERASGGTVFLDEIGEMAPSAQVKLLRVLQEGTYMPVGGEETRLSEGRVVAATNKDLQEEVRGGRFREDLYYRLNVYPIRLPALRERREDIPALIDFFLNQQPSPEGGPPRMEAAAQKRLMVYSFPGNVRELQNIVSALLIESRGRGMVQDKDVVSVFSRHRLMEMSDLPAETVGGTEPAPPDAADLAEDQVGTWVIEQLRAYHFNISLAERMLTGRKRSAENPRSVPVCSRSGLTYYLQGEGFRALAEQKWNLDAASLLVAGEGQNVARVRGKLGRFLESAIETVQNGGGTAGQRLVALRKAFNKLPAHYHQDLVRLAEDVERGYLTHD